MKDTLLIVSDLGRLNAYRLGATTRGTPRLELLEHVRMEDAHRRLVENVSDLAGRRASPTLKHWGAPMADEHNLKLETKRRLVKQIARHIQRLIRRHAPDACWLVAHKEINRPILAELPKAIRTRIEKTVQRDLVKAEPRELLGALELQPKPRGAASR